MAVLLLAVLIAGPLQFPGSETTVGGLSGELGPRVPADPETVAAESGPPVLPPPIETVVGPQPEVVDGAVFVVPERSGTIASVGSADPVVYGRDDILLAAPDGRLQLYVDGAGLGLGSDDRLDAISVSPDGTVLFSTADAFDHPTLGSVGGADVLAFEPASLGSVTRGVVSRRFDGSRYGLDGPDGNVDAVALAPDGRLLVSTSGPAAIPSGTAVGSDVLVVEPEGLGRYLDGAAVGLAEEGENVVALSVHANGALHLMTDGAHQVSDRAGATSVDGGRGSVLQCFPTSIAPIGSCLWSQDEQAAPASAVGVANGYSATSITGYFFDFDQPLGPEWIVYDSIGHAGWGLRRPSAVEVRSDHAEAAVGGVLAITAAMGDGDDAELVVSGGTKLRFPQVFGRYTVRLRVDGDPSDVTSGVVLLWPESNQHPRDGEIDIVESWRDRRTRTPVESNLHWLRPGAQPPFDRGDDATVGLSHPGVDGTRWHVFDLEWREDVVSVAVDGGPPVVLSTDPAHIASWAMEPTIQLDAFDSRDRPGQQPVLRQPVTMFVDYLAVRP